jgi:GNAT superfamily N-acetyltransferase
VRSSLTVRDLSRAEWAAAAGIAARAFFGEEFVVGMFGPDPLHRWAQVHHFYAAELVDEQALHLGAFLDDVQVGLVRVSPYGSCSLCAHVSATTPPADPVLARDWVFEVEALKAHAPFGPHAWISRVAVEPQLHGTGIGTALIDTALDRLAGLGAGTVLLECLAYREGFYAGRGFRREADLVDPYAGSSLLMRADLPTGRSSTRS